MGSRGAENENKLLLLFSALGFPESRDFTGKIEDKYDTPEKGAMDQMLTSKPLVLLLESSESDPEKFSLILTFHPGSSLLLYFMI